MDIKDVLQELRAERGPKAKDVARLDGMVAALERLTARSTGSKRFHAVPLGYAIHQLLTERGPLRVTEIVEVLLSSGYESKARSFRGVVTSRLNQWGSFQKDAQERWMVRAGQVPVGFEKYANHLARKV